MKSRIISRIAKYNSKFIRIFEKSKIDSYGQKEALHHPTFIIGAPRTGSTILYQILTNEFDTLYINNLIDNFHRNFFFGFWLSNELFKGKPHNSFKSELGNTYEFGLQAPSECAAFWYRWIPRGKHFVDKNEVSLTKIDEIRKNIYSVINYYDKSLVFKNMNAGLRLRMLKDVAPQLKLIFIKRDPVLTAFSILNARKKYYNDENVWWSIKPKEYHDINKLNVYQQLVKQIYYIEKQIHMDIKLFPGENVIITSYNELTNSTNELLTKISAFWADEIKRRKAPQKPILDIRKNSNEKNDILKKIRIEVEKLDWHDYTS